MAKVAINWFYFSWEFRWMFATLPFPRLLRVWQFDYIGNDICWIGNIQNRQGMRIQERWNTSLTVSNSIFGQFILWLQWWSWFVWLFQSTWHWIWRVDQIHKMDVPYGMRVVRLILVIEFQGEWRWFEEAEQLPNRNVEKGHYQKNIEDHSSLIHVWVTGFTGATRISKKDVICPQPFGQADYQSVGKSGMPRGSNHCQRKRPVLVKYDEFQT